MAALNILGDTYENRKLVRNMFGSSGIGGGAVSPLGSLLDMTPAGIPYQLNEAGAKIGRGQTLGGLLDAALAVTPIPAVAKKGARMGKLLAGGEKAAEKGITAYHGSPHTFDQFDTAKIGTGEGAQTYGHGLYFAEHEGTAQAYRKNLSGARDDFDGKIAPDLMGALKEVDYLGFDSAGQALTAIRQHPDWATRWDVPDPSRITAGIESHEARKYGGKGSMYQVRINADPEHFLDWDKTLSEQGPHVRDRLSPLGFNVDDADVRGFDQDLLSALSGDARTPLPKQPHDPGGANIYQSNRLIPGAYRDSAAASKVLAENGIPGIKYLDQGSRAAGNGSRNYVVFDPKIISIMKRYGVTGPVAAAMLASGIGADKAEAASAPKPIGFGR